MKEYFVEVKTCNKTISQKVEAESIKQIIQDLDSFFYREDEDYEILRIEEVK